MGQSRDDVARQYGTEIMAASFTPGSLEDYFRRTVRFGLIWDYGWLYAAVTSKGGQRYALHRGYEKASTNHVLTCKLQKDLSSVARKLYKHLYMGPAFFERLEEKNRILVTSYPARNNFKIEIEVNHFHWQEEEGAIDLQFEALQPACRWLNPGAGIQEDLYYTSELCQVTGTVLGEEVSGFGGLDQAWLPPGIGWTQCKIYQQIQDFWIVWANRYGDGSIEHGIGQYGAGGWNLGFFVQGGRPFISTDNVFLMTWAEEGYPLKADLEMGPHRFTWTCNSRLAEIKGVVLWANGQMVNTARKDTPVEGFSWIEFRQRPLPAIS